MEKKEFFKDSPYLQKFFKSLERKIKEFNSYEWNEYTTRENLIQKRDTFLKIAQTLNEFDLYILFYAKNLDHLGKLGLLKILKKVYQSKCNLHNTLQQKSVLIDPALIGEGKKRTTPKK